MADNPPGATDASSTSVVEITDETAFDDLLTQWIALVDFYADW